MTEGLAGTRVLILDCQATGSSPSQGHLLEIGWSDFCVNEEPKPVIRDYIIRLPEAEEIPRRVTMVTGLTLEQQTGAIPAKKAWKKLKASAGKIMRRVLGAISNRGDVGNVMTLANPEIVEEIKDMVEKS